MASSPRGRTGGRFRFRLGEPARRPDGRAGPGPCSPRALELLQPPPGWRLELRQPAAAMHSPFSPLGELPLTGGVTFQTLFLRLTEGVLALCRKRIPRKRPLRYLPTEEPTVPVAACDSIFPRTQIRPASPLLVLRCCPSPRVLERDPASRGVGTPVPKTGGLQPAARSCSSLCSPRAPCWCVWQKRPPGLSCEVQIPRSPGTSEPGAPSRRGQPPQTCPGLVGEGGTCSVRGPRTVSCDQLSCLPLGVVHCLDDKVYERSL